MRNEDSHKIVDILTPRKPIESAREMGVYTLALCMFPLLFLALPDVGFLPSPQERIELFLDVAPRVGIAAVDSMSWSLGAYITALIAVYAVYLGAGFASVTVEREVRTRRALGSTVVGATSLLLPLVGLMVWGAVVEDPSKLGTLFAASPLLALTVVLTVELGNFVVLSRSEKIATAEHSLARARTLLHDLPATIYQVSVVGGARQSVRRDNADVRVALFCAGCAPAGTTPHARSGLESARD